MPRFCSACYIIIVGEIGTTKSSFFVGYSETRISRKGMELNEGLIFINLLHISIKDNLFIIFSWLDALPALVGTMNKA